MLEGSEMEVKEYSVVLTDLKARLENENEISEDDSSILRDYKTALEENKTNIKRKQSLTNISEESQSDLKDRVSISDNEDKSLDNISFVHDDKEIKDKDKSSLGNIAFIHSKNNNEASHKKNIKKVKGVNIDEMESILKEAMNWKEDSVMTNGIGTKTFVAPEQMSNKSYNNKVDIYSLGIIFLILFYPTETLSERYMVLDNCRKGVLPNDFIEKYPEISDLIKRMTAIDDNVRPTAQQILDSTVFNQ